MNALAGVIGFLTLFIAYQQWNTNQLNVRIALYKERVLLYREAQAFVLKTVGLNSDLIVSLRAITPTQLKPKSTRPTSHFEWTKKAQPVTAARAVSLEPRKKLACLALRDNSSGSLFCNPMMGSPAYSQPRHLFDTFIPNISIWATSPSFLTVHFSATRWGRDYREI